VLLALVVLLVGDEPDEEDVREEWVTIRVCTMRSICPTYRFLVPQALIQPSVQPSLLLQEVASSCLDPLSTDLKAFGLTIVATLTMMLTRLGR